MSINRANIFSSKAICSYMLSSLSKEASPHLRDPYDAVALLAHACMIAVGFRLEGLGEDHNIEAKSDRDNTSPLPSEWNSTTTSNYAFRYAHDQSSLHYILKVSRLGSKAIINALGIGDEKVHTLEAPVRDFLSPSSLPFTAAPDPSSSSLDTADNTNKLAAVYLSAARITDLAALLKLQIIQKIAPGLRKEGYEESAHAASTTTPATAEEREERQREQPPQRGDRNPEGYDPLRDDPLPPAARPRPYDDPLAAEPRRPNYPAGDFPPPGFEDEYEMNRPPAIPGGGGRRPLNIGERDLYPPGLGPHDPLRMGPGPPGFGGGGGGMHPTFDDPLFAGRQGGGGRAPPGARYDPVGPGDGPPYLRGGPRFPGGGGGPPNPFGGFGGGDFI
ncbi:MAG: hypothetical protein LQ345_001780 [Seirophora villosa]|nr:MAG: hypothetical protein LQ345_001780 [Seirophora villosa]